MGALRYRSAAESSARGARSQAEAGSATDSRGDNGIECQPPVVRVDGGAGSRQVAAAITFGSRAHIGDQPPTMSFPCRAWHGSAGAGGLETRERSFQDYQT